MITKSYTMLSEILGNPLPKEENDRVLAAAAKAGNDLTKRGLVEPETVDAVADVRTDKKQIYEAANMVWPTRIEEGITMAESQTEQI